MDKNSENGCTKEDSNGKDSSSDNTQPGNCTEPVKKPNSNNLIRCDICCCEMSSTLVLNSHINGSRHKKKMKALEIVANLRALGQKGIDVGSEISTNCYRCDVCCLTVNSPQQLEIHLSGSKHKSKIAKERSLKFATITNMKPVPVSAYVPPLDNETPPSKRKKMNEQNLTCNVCNIGVNSETQYEQHVFSKKHLNKSKGEGVAKTPNASENEAILPQSQTPGNPLSESKEPERDDYQEEVSANSPQSGNTDNIIQVHSPEQQFKSESGNGAPVFSNYKPIPRHLLHHRQAGGQFGGVGLHEAGKFFAKPRPHMYHSNDSAVQTSPRP